MQKILVANRGEIALRIMRSIKEMGIKTVAIFSEADRHALHVRYADEAVCVGKAASAQSYLRADFIIQEAVRLGVDGIHPGFGFLSENADFVRKVQAAGITFIGPSAEAMEIMGDKISSKQAALKYNIPMVPGTTHAIESYTEALAVAEQIGFPLLVKASAGGGGKGMRIVQHAAELEEQMQRAISEAQAAFGNGAVFIEKYVSSPRHIEIQVLADNFGNTVHLFERECSIQRRHQKVVEEAPSCLLTPEVRASMGQSAINAAKACGYTNAGTVEFIVDEKMNYYFLEMNTRLQVEHSITEMITGIDIVKEQIKIAQNKPLSFTQNDLTINGHAIELRVYAEDPTNNFLPDIGNLQTYELPQGMGVRIDNGFEQGMDIPIYYDPMIAKLVTHAESRTAAIAKMLRAIKDYKITGIENTLAFGAMVMQHPAFVSGNFDTHFVQNYFTPQMLNTPDQAQEAEIAAWLAIQVFENQKNNPKNIAATERPAANNWRKNRTN